jgi:hypothetical protein
MTIEITAVQTMKADVSPIEMLGLLADRYDSRSRLSNTWLSLRKENGVYGVYRSEDVSRHGSPCYEHSLVTDTPEGIAKFEKKQKAYELAKELQNLVKEIELA